jgi:ribosomal protein L31
MQNTNYKPMLNTTNLSATQTTRSLLMIQKDVLTCNTQTCMSNLITNLHINIPQKICTNTKQILETQITKNDVTSQAHGFYTKSMKSLKSHSRDSKLIYH